MVSRLAPLRHGARDEHGASARASASRSRAL